LILISSAFAFFVVFFLRQNDEDLSEERDEVEEQVKRVVDEVAVASFVSRDDQLSVVANEAGHDADAAVKKHVLNSSASNKQVHERNNSHRKKTRAEHRAEVEHASLLSHQSAEGECNKDGSSQAERSRHQSGVDSRREFKQRSQSGSSEHAESDQLHETLFLRCLVRCDVINEEHAAEHIDPHICENRDHVSENGAASSSQKRQSQRRVDFLQMLARVAAKVAHGEDLLHAGLRPIHKIHHFLSLLSIVC